MVDVGSLDINGSCRGLFSRCHYVGIDLHEGLNVDVVGRAHEVLGVVAEDCRRKVESHYRSWLEYPSPVIDTMLSCECLEHDRYYDKTLRSMYENLRVGGLMLITAAGDGRPEHGTHKERPQDSPATNDYYRNISNADFYKVLPPSFFSTYFMRQVDGDFQFYGIKK